MSQKIYILCPANTVSGGPEALHQLCDALRSREKDAVIVYYPPAPGGHPVPAPYQGYDVETCPQPADDEDSVIVITEVVTSFTQHFHRARKAVWWLSVDDFFKWRHINPGSSIFEQTDCLHLAQSCYAMEFLRQRNVRDRHLLTDFVPPGAFLGGIPAPRLPIIVYNPKKGMEVTQSLMARCGDMPIWVKLEGLDQGEMVELLGMASIYVDFGDHAGRDRIPREAALSGAIVITGRRGAAEFVQDVPLPDRFRLNEQAPDFEAAAVALIHEVLGSEQAFLDASAEQESYRRWINHNRDAFMREVDHFIDVLAAGTARWSDHEQQAAE
jgi:hypothetical protein